MEIVEQVVAQEDSKSETFNRLTELFASILGREDLSADSDFFAMGGDSLRAIRLVAQAKSAFGMSLPTSILFEHRTVSALCSYLASEEALGRSNEILSGTREPEPEVGLL